MSVPLPPNVGAALQEVKAALRELYGDRLQGVYLYGSYARGTATEDSDVDVLLALEGEVQTSTEILRVFERIWRIPLQYDLLISILPVAANWLRESTSAFLDNVRTEGVRV